MRISSRYIFSELLKPFLFCLIACAALWSVFDIFSSLDEFTESKDPVSAAIIAQYYASNIPRMMVMVIPIAVLFSCLFTLLTLNRHNELVALMAGGRSPISIFTPFLMLALLASMGLFFIMSGPATRSEAIRKGILMMIKTGSPVRYVTNTPIFNDVKNRRLWYAKSVNVQTGVASDLEITCTDSAGRDEEKYFAQEGHWNAQKGYWELIGVRRNVYSAAGDVKDSTHHDKLDVPAFTTPPEQVVFVQSVPDEMNFQEINNFIAESSSQSGRKIAPYIVQQNSYMAYPLTPLILCLFALALGTDTNRRSPAAGVFNAIFVLIAYFFVSKFFEALGRGARIPPDLAAWGAPVLFLCLAIWMLQRKHALLWQVAHWWDNDIYEPQYRLEAGRKPAGLGYALHRLKVGVKYLFTSSKR